MPRPGMPRPTMTPGTDPAPSGTGSSTRGTGPRNVFATEAQRASASRFGLVLFLITLAMLFGAVMVLLLVLRLDDALWPETMPPLPWQIWLSTAVLVLESAVLVRCCRAETAQQAKGVLWMALVLAVVFLGSQVWAWCTWYGAGSAMPGQVLVTSGFYVVTGVHAAHVLGGLVPLGMLVWFATGDVWADRQRSQVRLTSWYWHFLDVVWVLLVVLLLLQ